MFFVAIYFGYVLFELFRMVHSFDLYILASEIPISFNLTGISIGSFLGRLLCLDANFFIAFSC